MRLALVALTLLVGCGKKSSPHARPLASMFPARPGFVEPLAMLKRLPASPFDVDALSAEYDAKRVPLRYDEPLDISFSNYSAIVEFNDPRTRVFEHARAAWGPPVHRGRAALNNTESLIWLNAEQNVMISLHPLLSEGKTVGAMLAYQRLDDAVIVPMDGGRWIRPAGGSR